MTLRAPFAALLVLGLASAAGAGEVISAKPDAVAVTIYRDGTVRTADLRNPDAYDTRGLALVVETRTVDLPAGRSRVRFEGVADGIIPQSAAVEGLPGRPVERNFDYDLLSPGALIAHSVGRTVRAVRTDARTGAEHDETATLVSGPDGVVLDFGGGRVEALGCGGETRRLVFDQAPAGLSDRPTLSVTEDARAAGRYKVTVSYLTVRLDWSADYIARINPGRETLDLTGWITLANRGATGFADAPTQVVAGHLARQPVDLPSVEAARVARECWPDETTHSPLIVVTAALQAMAGFRAPSPAPPRPMIVVTAQKRAILGQLGDYKLYTLAEPTTVAARQTKQVAFLSQPSVAFETVYARTIDPFGPASEPPMPAGIVLRLKNTVDEGLGRPLPAGSVSLRLARDGRELFAGEHPLSRDVPVGEPFEIDGGRAFDVTVAQRKTADAGRRQSYEIVAANAKSAPVTVEIRHPRDGAPGFRVTAESQPHGLKAGDPVWRLAVPAQGEIILSYTVERGPR